MDEHVASAIVRLDESVAALGVVEFYGACHCHRETPCPAIWSVVSQMARRLGRHSSQAGKVSAYSAGPRQEAERLSPETLQKYAKLRLWKSGSRASQPVVGWVEFLRDPTFHYAGRRWVSRSARPNLQAFPGKPLDPMTCRAARR